MFRSCYTYGCMKHAVSAIVCAYNEEQTIKPILEILLEHPRIFEVIVVDDGSTDHTWERITELRHKKLVALRHKTNLGKGAAITTAVKKSKCDILLFIDADLSHLLSTHIDLLLLPLTIDPSSMVIGLREPYRQLEKPAQNLLKSLNGERAFQKKTILPLLPRIAKSGYGIEVIINAHFVHLRRHVYYIPLPKLRHILKQDKSPVYQYIIDYVHEGTEVFKQYLLVGLDYKRLEQFFKKMMKKLEI